MILGIVVAVAVLVNYIYFSRKRIAAKYLTPGIIFLVIFQVFTLLYTGYIGFTNYGTGHNGTKDQAISSLLASAQERVEDSPTYPVTVVEQFGTYGLLVTDPESGDALLGTAQQPLEEVDARFEDGTAVAVDGWTTLPLATVFTLSEELEKLSVPFSDDPNDGSLRAPDGQKGYLYVSTLEYDEAADTITDTTTGPSTPIRVTGPSPPRAASSCFPVGRPPWASTTSSARSPTPPSADRSSRSPSGRSRSL